MSKRYRTFCLDCGFDVTLDDPFDLNLARGNHEAQFPEHKTKAATVVTCCGEAIECSGFTNTCEKCGRDYNWNGTQLAPRSCWGEETGEHPVDILNVDAYTAAELFSGVVE